MKFFFVVFNRIYFIIEEKLLYVFSVTKISIITDHDGEELFNKIYADASSDCQSNFEIHCSDVEIASLSQRNQIYLQNLVYTITRR